MSTFELPYHNEAHCHHSVVSYTESLLEEIIGSNNFALNNLILNFTAVMRNLNKVIPENLTENFAYLYL